MRVLFFMNHADQGGAALAFLELIENLHKDYDVECVVFTGKHNNINEKLTSLNIENYSSSYRNFMSSYHSPYLIWKGIFWLRHLIGNNLALKDIPQKIDISSFDLIYTNLDRIDIGAILAEKYSIPHIWHIREHLDTDFKVISVVNNYVKYMERFNSNFIAISNSVKQAWIDRGMNSRIEVIYDGVNNTNIPAKENWFRNGIVNFLFLGGYAKEKGQIDFLENIKDLPFDIKKQIRISFFGSNYQNQIDEMNEVAIKNGLQDIVEFSPYIEDIYSIIKDYDVGINYSDDEGFGRVTVEYMSAGLCVLCSNSGANKELVKNEKTGILVDKNDKEMLINSIERIVNYREEIIQIGENAQKDALNYSMKTHSRKMFEQFCVLQGDLK